MTKELLFARLQSIVEFLFFVVCGFIFWVGGTVMTTIFLILWDK